MVEPSSSNPLASFLHKQSYVVLDGGLATALEACGHDLDDELWSAKLLLEDPEAIQRVHSSFLEAGADCITTSTYQATLPGFRKRGLSDAEGVGLLQQSVDLAVEARDAFWSQLEDRSGRLRPLVAASIGPYGAFLADGSEYTGDYGIDDDELYAFHRQRWQILADSPADLLACETIPSRREAGVLMRLLRETPGKWAWLSFSCRDQTHLSDGSLFADAVADCDRESQVAAVGINCTSPDLVSPLIVAARKQTVQPIIVYPNSGESWNSGRKIWMGSPSAIDWSTRCVEWFSLGVTGIGGCCRVGPQEIALIRQRLVAPKR